MFKCEIQNSIRNQSEELPVNMVFRPQKAIIVFIIFCMINTKLCEMCRGDLYLKEQLEKETGKKVISNKNAKEIRQLTKRTNKGK